MRATTVAFLLFAASVSTADALRCRAGWFGDGSSREVSESRINDGYCDCPFDGADEVETGACAGSAEGGWAGVQASVSEAPTESKLQCPQQKSLMIPSSRIGDGLCDCCDGADEPPSSGCPDICDTVLAAERAAHFKAVADFAAGAKKRKDEMEEFTKMFKETMDQIERMSSDEIPKLEEEVNSVDAQIRDLKQRYMEDRMAAVKEIQDSMAFIGGVVSEEEILSFIIASCQFAGEILNSDGRLSNQKTCVPLRLAGLDVGVIWENENFSEFSASVRRLVEGDDTSLIEFATLLDKNSGGDEVSFGRDDSATHHNTNDRHRDHHHRDRHRHRHMDDDDDDVDEDMDDDDYPYEEDDDYPHNYPGLDEEEHQDEGKQRNNGEDEQSSRGTADERASNEENEEKTRDQIVKEAVQSNIVFTSRVPFKNRAKRLVERIDLIRKEGENEESDEGGDARAEDGAAVEDGASQPVDPMAIQMISGLLSRKLRQLERGEDFATSAKILLDSLLLSEDAETMKPVLVNLAIGTVYHGKLSAADVSELFYAFISELRGDDTNADDTCGSTHPNMCPPQTVIREGVSLPPAVLVSAAEALCEERASPSMTCVGEESDVDDEDIPNSIPDGYYGYYPPRSRIKEDGLIEHFSPLDNLSPSRTLTSGLEENKSDADRRLINARNNLRDLEKKIGSKDEHKFGEDGELYGIRDSCHKVESGKYEYELCIFGKATQRDKGQKGGGTNLGKWSGIKRVESTGERVLTWERGTKCWNGPQRSATATVTCGAETKVLTADEPRTCEYEMKMESHIACDDAFKRLHDL